jgi:hypothetical protein
MSPKISLCAGCLGLQALLAPLGVAQVNSFTNVADFDTAISSGFSAPQVTNFDSVASGTLIASGSAVEGTTFTYDLGGGAFEMQVGPAGGFDFDTTSEPNYLGTTGDDSFLSGDAFTMTFAQPEQAVGLFVISGGDNLDGDYALGVAQGSAESSGTTDSTFGTLADGGNVYFIGLIEANPANSFTSATFSSVGGLGIPFNIDDISAASVASTNAVSDVAATWCQLLGALAAVAALRFARTRAKP